MCINKKQLPIKAHFFFFMAATGPILPFLPVFGKQLGISPLVFGSVTAILPIVFLIAKPCFGLIVDHYHQHRKCIFICLLILKAISFSLMYFLPQSSELTFPAKEFSNVTCDHFSNCNFMNATPTKKSTMSMRCEWNCENTHFVASMVLHDSESFRSLKNVCFEEQNLTNLNCSNSNDTCKVWCEPFEENVELYSTFKFWGFVLLMSLGTIGHNVANCISDTICFDVLGEDEHMGYGMQRVWGTIGFGLAAFLSGFSIDLWSGGQEIKDYTPAFLISFVFSIIDILFCKKLKLPDMSRAESIIKDVFQLVRLKSIAIFLIFAMIAGTMDSFMVYFLFWHMEDLALKSGYMQSIKLIEGLTVAAQTLVGEVIFFALAGKILKKIGFGPAISVCFIFYGLRIGLMSLALTPWWIPIVELFTQGPSYALCYTTIVAYSRKVSPPGTAATVQGIILGMDDGLGFAVGSMIGGILYKNFGGSIAMRIFSISAIITSFVHSMLYMFYLKY